tara:strand:+ start:197 stop:565 length:369 start_codon:yes stop_codon:yes gene_type:complete
MEDQVVVEEEDLQEPEEQVIHLQLYLLKESQEDKRQLRVIHQVIIKLQEAVEALITQVKQVQPLAQVQVHINLPMVETVDLFQWHHLEQMVKLNLQDNFLVVAVVQVKVVHQDQETHLIVLH